MKGAVRLPLPQLCMKFESTTPDYCGETDARNKGGGARRADAESYDNYETAASLTSAPSVSFTVFLANFAETSSMPATVR